MPIDVGTCLGIAAVVAGTIVEVRVRLHRKSDLRRRETAERPPDGRDE